MSRKSLLLAAAWPVFGVIALVVRAELRTQGDEWRVRVGGYDPRDPISGHYLQYAYQWSWSGNSTCEDPPEVFRGEASVCCVCLRSAASGRIDPAATRVPCEEIDACEAWLTPASVAGPQKFFVPEEHALRLESLLRERTAHVGLVVREGQAIVNELYLDGKPFTEVVRAP